MEPCPHDICGKLQFRHLSRNGVLHKRIPERSSCLKAHVGVMLIHLFLVVPVVAFVEEKEFSRNHWKENIRLLGGEYSIKDSSATASSVYEDGESNHMANLVEEETLAVDFDGDEAYAIDSDELLFAAHLSDEAECRGICGRLDFFAF